MNIGFLENPPRVAVNRLPSTLEIEKGGADKRVRRSHGEIHADTFKIILESRSTGARQGSQPFIRLFFDIRYAEPVAQCTDKDGGKDRTTRNNRRQAKVQL